LADFYSHPGKKERDEAPSVLEVEHYFSGRGEENVPRCHSVQKRGKETTLLPLDLTEKKRRKKEQAVQHVETIIVRTVFHHIGGGVALRFPEGKKKHYFRKESIRIMRPEKRGYAPTQPPMEGGKKSNLIGERRMH